MKRDAAFNLTNPIPTEHAEQCTVIAWARRSSGKYPSLRWLYAVPNGQNKTQKQAEYFHAEGLTAGVSDLCLPDPRGGFHGFYLEMKRTEGGKISPEQTAFLEFAKSKNYLTHVARGADDAILYLREYLRLPETVTR